MENLTVETLPILGVCNLCLSDGVVQSMFLSNEDHETPADLLLKCFYIDLAKFQLGDAKFLICDSCAEQLNKSMQFKKQVESTLQILEEAFKNSLTKQESDSETVDNLLDDVFDGYPEPVSKHASNYETTDKHLDGALDGYSVILAKQESDSETADNLLDDAFDGYPEPVSKHDSDYETTDKHLDGTFDGYSKIHLPTAVKKEEILDKPSKAESTLSRTRDKTLSSIKKSEKIGKKKHIKKKVLLETQILLNNGLFPFKIKRNNTFSCAICSEKSTNLDDIKNHISEHSVITINCAFTKMRSNMQRFYKAEDKLCCKLCLKYIDNYEELKSHITSCNRLFSKSDWNMLPFKLDKDQTQCPVCKQVFLNFVNLNSHMNEHFPNYICENCGKAFASKGRLRGHVRTHEIGEFSCKYCDMVFDRVTKRENHVSKEHKSGIRYACKRCKISLPSFYARQKHLAEAHNEELKRYKCKACDQSYITPGHLSGHVRRDHLNERNHKCSKCELAFFSRNSLKMHMIKHDGERIHTCPVCQKAYQRKKTLKEHMRIHTNDKRFVCPVCGRAFTQKCTLKGHMRVHKDQID